jgi:hypothetical protein
VSSASDSGSHPTPTGSGEASVSRETVSDHGEPFESRRSGRSGDDAS